MDFAVVPVMQVMFGKIDRKLGTVGYIKTRLDFNT